MESIAKKASAEKAVRDIRRRTGRRFSAEEKIRIVIEGLRGEESITSLCHHEGIVANRCYRGSKEFLEAGKKRLLGDTPRAASSSEVPELRQENARLKELVAETVLENRLALSDLGPRRLSAAGHGSRGPPRGSRPLPEAPASQLLQPRERLIDSARASR